MPPMVPKLSPPPHLTFSQWWWENPSSITVWEALDSSLNCRRRQCFLLVTNEWGRRTLLLRHFAPQRGSFPTPKKLTHLLNSWSTYWKLTWEVPWWEKQRLGCPLTFLPCLGSLEDGIIAACSLWVFAAPYTSCINCHFCVLKPLPNFQTL